MKRIRVTSGYDPEYIQGYFSTQGKVKLSFREREKEKRFAKVKQKS